MQDYYKILSIDKNASFEEIKVVYRKLAMEWHPDKNKSSNAQEKFIEIHEAYEILVDPIKRTLYDSVQYENNLTSHNTLYENKQQEFSSVREAAYIKAQYFSKISFDKYFTDFLSGVDEIKKGCSFLLSIGLLFFFIYTGFKFIQENIGNYEHIWIVLLGVIFFFGGICLLFKVLYNLLK